MQATARPCERYSVRCVERDDIARSHLLAVATSHAWDYTSLIFFALREAKSGF
jgi:hypothetical protein